MAVIDRAEQPYIGDGRAGVDVKVGDGMAVALKDALVCPAGAAVVIGIVGAVAGHAGVKVQVGHQLVALAGGGYAVRESGVVSGSPRSGGGVAVAVAVEVVADGVDLGQHSNVNQVVVIGIVVAGALPRNACAPETKGCRFVMMYARLP